MTYFLKRTIYADRCALYAWTGISAEGVPECPSPCLWARLGSRRSWGSQWRPTAMQERLRWEKDCDCSILPAFKTKLSSASKNQSFLQIPKPPNNSVVSTVLSHPAHTNVHDLDDDFYLDVKPLLHCWPKKQLMMMDVISSHQFPVVPSLHKCRLPCTSCEGLHILSFKHYFSNWETYSTTANSLAESSAKLGNIYH